MRDSKDFVGNDFTISAKFSDPIHYGDVVLMGKM